jgi:two-component system, sensor histidine kinase and response regulator
MSHSDSRANRDPSAYLNDLLQAEQQLRERERQLESLMGHLPGLAYRALADEHWTALFVSKGIEDLTGYPADEFTSRRLNYADIMLPEDRPATREAVFTALRERRMYEAEHRIRHKDGSVRWIWARGHGVFAPDGALRFIEGLNLDMTHQKQTEEALRASERRFRVFVDHAADAFFLTDEQGRVLDVNRRACENLGYTRDELIGMSPFDFVDLEPTVFADRIGQLLAGEAVAFESRHRRKDGTVFPVETRAKSFREGGRQFLVSLARDVTERKQAEERLRESEQRWRNLTEALPQLVWSATPDGTCDYFSSQWTEHTGVAEAELLGWRWLETLHPDDREPTRRFWLESVAGHHSYDIEYRVRRKGGDYRWFKTRGVPIRDTGGNIIKWFGTCTDITELRDSEERFRGTFENAAVGIGHRQLDGRFLRVNQRFCNILGYSRDELLQRTGPGITHPDDLAAGVDLAEALLRGEVPGFTLEKRYVRRDGSPVWVDLSVSLQRDAAGKPDFFVGIVQDISNRKQLEGELRQAKEAAEAANRAKDEFLANVSHEIRTPMNAILGMTELALDTPLTEDQRQYLKAVKSGAESLLGLINDLLDFSKIEAAKMELEPAPFSLRAAVGDTLRVLASRAHKKGLELASDVHPDVPDALVGDAGRLRQVLLNLVGNAIKFTEEGEVVVRVKAADAPAPEGEVELHVEVRDTGIGIAPDKRETIFRAFEQEDTSTTRKYGGTGLGLTIASRLVALMGGTIGVESEPGRGSTFTFTVRLGRQSDQPEPTAARPPVRLHDLRVLVVDDNATNRLILESWLRDWQMEPHAAGDGLSALNALWHAAAAGRPYPLVLLDARMPDTDGLKLAAMIRERAELSATRLILLTSGDRPGDPARVRELRIDAHLLKPVQPDELLETIARVMNHVKGDSPRTRPVSLAEPVPTPPAAATPLRVLVAEDNELSASLLEKLLARRGHEVTLARNGRDALALAAGGGFDLLLLDVHMPEMDGFQVVEAIRERERAAGGHLPVVALTARSRKEDRERCLAAGMDEFLSKPIKADDLYAAVDRLGRKDEGERMKDEPLRMSASGSSLVPDPSLPGAGLLDPRAVLAACKGDAAILDGICQVFRAGLPGQLEVVRAALQGRDAGRLREAAHRLCGTIGAFSTVAGSVASDIEDRAEAGQLDEARPLVEQLETMTRELMTVVVELSVDTLRQQAGR